MTSRLILWTAGFAVLLSSAVDAAPRKAKRPVRKAATKVIPKPVVPAPPVTPGIMIPKAVNLTKPLPAEARAHAIWTLRAALNVAALQCQYSPFLRSVDNYNQMLRKHGPEVMAAQDMMMKHFMRTVKRGGMAAFDRYNTRSYNSFSTLDAQYNFCWAAGQAGQAVRMANVGTMASLAQVHVPLVRAALGLVPPAAGLVAPALKIPTFPALEPITGTE
jgi:hypothetical protein